MKTKTSQLTKLGILLIGILLFFTNCEKQESVESIESRQSKYLITKVKGNEINKNFRLIKKISDLKQNKGAINGYATRYNNVQFNLNLNEATYIESADGSLHSYTFSIYNEYDSYDINNIVLVSYSGQDYEAYLSTYTLTQEERIQLESGINLDLSQKASLETFDINQINTYSRVGGGCFDLVLTEVYSDCPAGHNAFACTTDCCGGCFGQVHEWQEVDCPGGGGGGGTGGGDGSGGTGTGTGGGGGSGSGGDNVIPTTPVISYEDGTDAQADFIVSLFNNNNLTLTSQQITWLNKNNSSLPDVIIFLNQNNYSIESLQFLQEIINFDISEGGLKQKMKQAVANGITTTAEYAHKIFKKFSQFAEQNPSIIPVLNSILEGISNTVSPLVNTSPSTCTFTDLFNMWIFELGPNPISINGTTTSTNQLKNQEGVNQARSIAINQIQNGNLQTVNHQWVYGQTQFYDGMVGGNFVTSFLGTYSMTVSISTTQSGYQLNFHVWNTSSWTSATRLRIDNDGDGAHDGIFPNTSRTNEDDLSLGGNFTQHWYWSEPVN